MQISQTKICKNKKKAVPLHRFLIHNCLIYLFQIMITSQTFIQDNARKYRAKVEFMRVYNDETREWLHYYSHEKGQTLCQFLESIHNTIGTHLQNCIVEMAYHLYSFYYYADNIKIRKEGDRITIFYDAIRK